MNRLTKEIGLVLISSSLTLHGCSGRPQPTGYEFAREGDRGRPGTEATEDFSGAGDFSDDTTSPGHPTTTSHAASSGHHYSPRSHVPIFIPLGGRTRTVSPGAGTSSGFRPSPTASSGARVSSGSGTSSSHVGGSVRGGFGSTGHGVSS